MMSWAGGWFFLMAAEQFTLGDRQFQLPGLGSYLQAAANHNDVRAILAGLATLIGLIVLLDRLIWRPLVALSQRYQAEVLNDVELRSAVLDFTRRSRAMELIGTRCRAPAGSGRSDFTRPGSPRRGRPHPLRASRDGRPARRAAWSGYCSTRPSDCWSCSTGRPLLICRQPCFTS